MVLKSEVSAMRHFGKPQNVGVNVADYRDIFKVPRSKFRHHSQLHH